MGIAAKFGKIRGYIKDYGINYAIKKIYYRFEIKYIKGKKYCPFGISEEQRKKEEAYKSTKAVKISIVVPLYNTPTEFLKDMIESVRAQTYDNWELCLADASDSRRMQIRKTVEQYMSQDKRIKYRALEKNDGISENTNRAVEMAAGEYIGLMDHDDLLHQSSLYYVAKSIEEKKADFIYTDELSFVGRTDRVQSIHFKPDFSWETFRNNNFICHFTVFKKELFEITGGFRKEFDGSQDYDLFLRLLEVTDKVCHIPKVLYFWRLHAGSVASGVLAKPYTIEAGRMALCEHLKRKNILGTVSASLEYGPFYTINYNVPEKIRVLVLVQGEQSEKLARREIKKTAFKCDLKKKDEFEIENIGEYTYVFLVSDGYEMYQKTDVAQKDDKGIIDELVQCLQPNDNLAASAAVYYKNKVYSAGYCYSSSFKEYIRPLYRSVPIKDPAYMNRLKFRQNVSLLGGGIFALKANVYADYIRTAKSHDLGKLNSDDCFSDIEWFKICLFIEKEKQKNCVLSPLKPLEITKNQIKKEEKTDYRKLICDNEITFENEDTCYNENMNLFGKYYFLWNRK